MSADKTAAVVARARALMQSRQVTRLHDMPLRGKNIGLLCVHGDSDDATLFRSAATELGARVATIHPHLPAAVTPMELRHTARVLGRLYDAIECQEISAGLVKAIEADAGVPVYAAIASAGHPIVELAPLLGNDVPLQDRLRCLVQSLLLCSMV